MLIKMQIFCYRKFNDCFIFVAIVVSAFIIISSISFTFFLFSSTFAFFVDKSQRRKKEIKVKLMYTQNTWYYKCVHCLNKNVSMIFILSSNFKIKKCVTISTLSVYDVYESLASWRSQYLLRCMYVICSA